MNKVRMIAIIVMVALMGFGAYAFAGNGMGAGKGQMGKGQMGNGGGCAAMLNSLSAEDQAKVKAEQEAFLKDTEAIRTQIQQKALELKTEMQKAEPDAEKAAAIQKEISDLHAQMDQKRIQHHINLKKINAAFENCFMGGHRGMKPGMGRQNCTNCPNCPAASQDSTL